MTIEPVKFIQITRTIDPQTFVHYLDAIDTNGMHWMAQMTHNVEPWITYKSVWYQDPQQPKQIND